MEERKQRKQCRESFHLKPGEKVILTKYAEFTETSKSEVIHIAVQTFIRSIPQEVRNKISENIRHGE